MASVRIPESLETRLEHIMEVTRRSKSFLINDALEMYLDDVEDGHIALERTCKPKRKFYSSAEVLDKINKGDN